VGKKCSFGKNLTHSTLKNAFIFCIFTLKSASSSEKQVLTDNFWLMFNFFHSDFPNALSLTGEKRNTGRKKKKQV